ncbi:nuclear transport factor 2 family protein [Winogradskyella maritima]|uniref:Nuclear transport factor 2 family protein n=1 Tax=Winogradskyella maritima TaxID=1517766 RepID=A0ABV8AJN3_9FLAO|nr:nuclear transport factor 2 family protein [Winogradskyella maritima]
MTAKEVVKSFYNADLANDASIVQRFFHKDCELHWNSSRGFTILNYDDIVDFFVGTRDAYNSLRFQFSHILVDGNFVTTRHSLYAITIEQPEDEELLAHFTSIWEVKDHKLYRCYEISQLADEKTISSNSFKEIKV